MPSATASGADAGGGARNREHNQGNQGRTYTAEQKAAVLRIRKCSPTAFYDILGLEEVRATVTDGEIKKAYRKQSLLTHPDKNGHEHADEAFKMVSRAFGVLGDKEKREKYDRFGTDPDSRFGQSQAQNPFSGFGRRQAGGGGGGGGGGGFGGGGMEEMTPEEMFQRFFGGGFGGGGPFGGGFDTGPQFVFNFGGGPGFRVHQFGGARPRRRPREAAQQEGGGLSTLMGLLPILLLFVFPLISSLFSGGGSSTPGMVFDNPQNRYTLKRVMPALKASYFVDPRDVEAYTPGKLHALDKKAENLFVQTLLQDCEKQTRIQERMRDEASGWFFQDPEKMKMAHEYEKPACKRLNKFGIRP
ncbi:putative J domain-containing protein C17A3.05c [Colletotrichum chlorophyti]|uniref:Putative J domain-containing protein C17A3.05c n=1 Tax=Colletotrichum chlorophyti TaxID=708187 RepID=A0A1Q8RSK9_9PEZI|nr:putative J domain-containing protein C17A3.05c [Colletotrichum chlorophyti]